MSLPNHRAFPTGLLLATFLLHNRPIKAAARLRDKDSLSSIAFADSLQENI
jgi:hypothetical protein